MATIHDLLVKFNIPEDGIFEIWYSEKVYDELLNGELIVDKNRYTIQYEDTTCEIDIDNGKISILNHFPDSPICGGYTYTADGAIGIIN